MSEHKGKLTRLPGPLGYGKFIGVCTCGYMTKPTIYPGYAESHLADHIKAQLVRW